MKKIFVKPLKYNLLLVGIVFLFWNCEKENQNEHSTESKQTELSVEIVSYDHLKSSNPEVVKAINLQKNTNSASENDFYIEESKVQIIQQPNFTTYTFFVIRNNPLPNILENYTYKEYDNGTFEQYLLKYQYTVDSAGALLFDTNTLEIEFIDGESLITKSSFGCVPQFVEVVDDLVCTYQAKCWGPGAGGHEVGDNCNCQQSIMTCFPPGTTKCEYQYIWVYQGCDSSGTQNNSDNDSNTNDAGGSSSNNDTQSIPLPDPRPIWQPIADCVNSGQLGQMDTTVLNPTTLEQSDLTSQEWLDLHTYLQNTNCSEEAQIIVIGFIEMREDTPEMTFELYEEILEFETGYRSQMTEEELSIFDSLSHSQQMKYLWSAYDANALMNYLYSTDCEKRNGKGDAIRHAYWNALSTKRIGMALTYHLTTAHENHSLNYAFHHKEQQMDLHNNQIGRNLGQLEDFVIRQAVLDALDNGDLLYLNNLSSINCRATHASQLTPTNQ